ncbi:MAG: peptidoglycan DD-metalloendopeptidase family protein [Magnetococcales bacterium]|nr:peptidoglycan DD-metalloendopeptidase family protein [Magnetococcales bacterium]
MLLKQACRSLLSANPNHPIRPNRHRSYLMVLAATSVLLISPNRVLDAQTTPWQDKDSGKQHKSAAVKKLDDDSRDERDDNSAGGSLLDLVGSSLSSLLKAMTAGSGAQEAPTTAQSDIVQPTSIDEALEFIGSAVPCENRASIESSHPAWPIVSPMPITHSFAVDNVAEQSASQIDAVNGEETELSYNLPALPVIGPLIRDDFSENSIPVPEVSPVVRAILEMTPESVEVNLPAWPATAPVVRKPIMVKDTSTPAGQTVRESVAPGETIDELLARQGMTENAAREVIEASRPIYDLSRRLRHDSPVRLSFGSDGALTTLVHPIGNDQQLRMSRSSSGRLIAKLEPVIYDVRLRTVSGTVNSSLVQSIRRSGLSRHMARRLISLFEWDVDLARDLEESDRFSVAYEEYLLDGEKAHDGQIIAAELVNQGQSYRIVRYTDPQGVSDYYTEKGEKLRKMFLRTPIDSTHVSSRFSSSRLHPVLGFNRAHRGVDYSAPVGTPVRASADGQVVEIGWQGGYGNMVVIQHNRKYATAYAHLNEFSEQIDVGSRVKQGHVVGYVGTTGLTTGPHLHYEVRVNDQPVNPLSVQLTMADALQDRYRADFKKQSERYLALLDQGNGYRMAMNSSRQNQTDP